MNRQRTLTRTNLLGFVCTYWEPRLQGEDVHHITLFLYHPRLFSVLFCRRRFSQRHLFFFWLKKKNNGRSVCSLLSPLRWDKDYWRTRAAVSLFFFLSVLTYVFVGVCFTFFVIDMRSCVRVCMPVRVCVCRCDLVYDTFLPPMQTPSPLLHLLQQTPLFSSHLPPLSTTRPSLWLKKTKTYKQTNKPCVFCPVS